jgi:exopolysaccharide biosynthesis polyprenyl glycosylphosphotransferase
LGTRLGYGGDSADKDQLITVRVPGRDGQSSVARPRPSTHRMEHRRPAARPRARWEVIGTRTVIAADVTAIIASIALHAVWGTAEPFTQLWLTLAGTVLVLTLVWLGIMRAWDPQILWHGSAEFAKLLRALTTSAVALGLLGLAFKLPETRPWVFGVIPVAALLAVLGRLAIRQNLYMRRRRGTCLRPVLAVGTVDSVAALVARTRRAPSDGWVVTGACTPTGAGNDARNAILDVPVLGDLDSVGTAAERGEFRIVSVSPTPGWTSKRLHMLAWDLEGTGIELLVDPGLMEIGTPRLQLAAVDGFPMLRLSEPAFVGVPRAVKSVVDRVGAVVLLLILAPLMVALAIAVRADGPPVFYKQRRVGKDGAEFQMIKFRSMVANSHLRRAELARDDLGAGPMFKMRDDPRVTRVGALLRRYSLDELPQLFNVLAGHMSLVGPRPALPEEAETYTRAAQRKLLVKPGLTGLWQISGRSDLSWEESVRLDLRYAENWTLALDALILWRTIGAVVRGRGAY